jgi:uncharacterized membrane protein (TIGR02234 family)
MSRRLWQAVAAILGVAGAGLVLAAAGRTWADITPGPEIPGVRLTGDDLNGAISALGWAALAGTAAILVTRGWARAVIGGLVAAFGVLVAVLAPAAAAHGRVVTAAGERNGLIRTISAPVVHVAAAWPAVSVAGGVLLAAAGVLAAVWGRRWPGPSSRYDRPGAAAPEGADPASMWKAIDRGDDPTSSEVKER